MPPDPSDVLSFTVHKFPLPEMYYLITKHVNLMRILRFYTVHFGMNFGSFFLRKIQTNKQNNNTTNSLCRPIELLYKLMTTSCELNLLKSHVILYKLWNRIIIIRSEM